MNMYKCFYCEDDGFIGDGRIPCPKCSDHAILYNGELEGEGVEDVTDWTNEISEFKNVLLNNKNINKMNDTKIEIDYLLSLLNKAEIYAVALKDICDIDDHDVTSGYWMKELALKALGYQV